MRFIVESLKGKFGVGQRGVEKLRWESAFLAQWPEVLREGARATLEGEARNVTERIKSGLEALR